MAEDGRQALLDLVERDRDRIIGFLQDFIRARSPNPPGDTRKAAAHVRRFLDGEGLAYRVIAPQKSMPNIAASFEGGAGPGRHSSSTATWTYFRSATAGAGRGIPGAES